MSRKILFLDIDGVVNSADFMKAEYERLGKGSLLGISQPLADEVRRIIEFTQCEVVLSSSWRLSERGRQQVLDEVCEYIDVTPTLRGLTDRGCEVLTWLDNNPGVDAYAILDDNSDFHKDQHLFKTSWQTGITRDITIAVIEHLNGAKVPGCKNCGKPITHRQGGKVFCSSQCVRDYAKSARPLQAEAHRQVKNAVKRGDLRAPQHCEDCGKAYARLHAHHDNYREPLHVNWLCLPCHNKRDHHA